MLHLYDTATGQVRELAMRDPGTVSVYVCGPTVYGPPHIGHGRMAITFDVLRRYLEWSGLTVRFVSNITDIDDKIIDRANTEGRPWEDIAREVRGHLVEGHGRHRRPARPPTSRTPPPTSTRWWR